MDIYFRVEICHWTEDKIVVLMEKSKNLNYEEIFIFNVRLNYWEWI